jgi:hypothetical protein
MSTNEVLKINLNTHENLDGITPEQVKAANKAEIARLREVIKGIYDTLTRELAEPKGTEIAAMILCCTAIEVALAGEKGGTDADR